jgi:amino acid transporter
MTDVFMGTADEPTGGGAGEKGLKSGALGMLSSIVIGVASTAPGYSLAATLGFVIAVVGVKSPSIMIAAFIPMGLSAAAYYYFNRADPDCGTSFSWVTRAFGPVTGWITGWAIIIADLLVMGSLAQIAGSYTFKLVGADGLADDVFWVTVLGVIFIAGMSYICYVGIEVSAKTQYGLLAMEMITLTAFAVVALGKVAFGNPPGALTPELSWLWPGGLTLSEFTEGVLLAIFIYWGWDTCVSVNEESEDSTEGPGKAAVISTVVLLGIYVIVTVAAQAYGGVDALADSDDVLSVLAHDVLGPFDKLLIIAVLTSAAASCQTTILPAARTQLSMAAKRAIPTYFGKINEKGLTPGTSTVWFGIIACVWYAGLTRLSIDVEIDVLGDSILSLGLMIAFYLGITGFACVWYYRKHLFDSFQRFVAFALLPGLSGILLLLVFIKSCIDYSDPANSESGESWFGWGPPLVIAIGFLILGVVLMIVQWVANPDFFKRKRELPSIDIVEGRAVAEGSLIVEE